MRRVVITGMGTVNPLGKNVEEFWANIKANKNGLSYVDQFDTENFPVKIVGAVKDFDCTVIDIFSILSRVLSFAASPATISCRFFHSPVH